MYLYLIFFILAFDINSQRSPTTRMLVAVRCFQGEIGTEMYIVMSGQVEVVGGAKDDVIFATLHQGSVFGEIR